jgi:predicted butyrate kinase (DUF1464 family)
MTRVIGIDPGTISIDLCGLEEGQLFLDRSLPTGEALADPSMVLAVLAEAHHRAPLDLVAGPSGYGLPLTAARDLTDLDLRLACLAPEGESGGMPGLASLMRAMARSEMPIVFTPGVVHLASVPPHRKVNRADMGTADKVCTAALAVREHAGRRRCTEREVSFVLVELGGAFTAALAVDRGSIVDGLGGTCGPLGVRASGALDGEVAFLAGSVTKGLLFVGGVATIADAPTAPPESLAAGDTPRHRLAWDAFAESILKAVAALRVSVPAARDVILSGRLVQVAAVRERLTHEIVRRIDVASVHVLEGFATVAKHAAQGAALVADGLAGGRASTLVDTMGIRRASGTVLDHLYLISPSSARARLRGGR